MKQNIIDRINHLANEKEPFLFVVNYAGSEAYIRKLSEIAIDDQNNQTFARNYTRIKQMFTSRTNHPLSRNASPCSGLPLRMC